jgi:tRNA(Arg) A34 adenosine deaminase TadA
MEAVWSEVFRLMWEAYRSGTIPVGAVVADETGTIVSRGRNRIFGAPHDGQLGGTRLAHAEVNALTPLASDRTHERLTLYSALEPCHLCLSAAIAVRVGTVRYAAPDPYGGGVGKLVPSVDHMRHPIAVEGPLARAEGRLAEALHVAHFLWRLPESNVVAFYGETRPDVLAAARRLPSPDVDATLADALAALA